MNKLTANIFVVLLGIVAVGAAHADIASTSYVDKQKTAIETGVSTALATKADKATTLAGYGIEDGVTAAAVNTALDAKANVADLGSLAGKSAVGTIDITDASVTKAKLATDVQVTLGKADTALQAANLTEYAKTADVNTELATKADKATTIAGYGITDAMTTTEVTTALGAKADTADVSTALGLKADKTAIADMETKTNSAATYALKATETVASGAAAAAAAAQSGVNALDAAVSNATTGLVATKKIADDAATASAANTAAIATKADKATTISGYGITDAMTTTAINTALGTKADASALAAKADKATTIAGYGITDAMTAAAINSALVAKVNTTDLGALATAAPGACSNAANKCVLTFNGTAYGWEVVER